MKEIIQNVKLYFKKYMRGHGKILLIIFLLLLISLSVSMILPYIVSLFIDNLNSGYDLSYFHMLAVIYFSLVILKIVVEIVNSYISERLGWTISNTLRCNLVEHCINLDFSFHSNHRAGELIERVDGDVSFLANFFSEFFVNIVGNTIFVLSIVFIFYSQSGIIGLGYSVIVILAYCAILLLQNRIMILWGKYREDEAQLYGYLQESILAREDIIGVGEEAYLKNKLKKMLLKIKNDFRRASMVSNIPTSSFFGLLNIGDFLAIGIGVYLFYRSQLSLGSIYLISNYVGLLNRPFIALRYEFDNLQKMGASLNRISQLFSLKSNINDGGKDINSDNITIEIRNVTFKYGKNQVPALNNFSLKIKNGEKVGIVGRTGSGKTTLIRLISKMYEVDEGEILLNGVNVKELNLKSLYENICFIAQNVRIFNGTIYENITCFETGISKESVMRAVENVGMLDWINSFPNGMDTILEKDMLSSGQAQMLHICRAFLQDANIYIFDEINSKLDLEAEEKIFKALAMLSNNKTVLLIAHKLKILDFVDKILIIENGKIKSFGSRKEIPNEIIERNIE